MKKICRKDQVVTIRENGINSFESIKSLWLEPDRTTSVVKKE
jgi:hypothetical protein